MQNMQNDDGPQVITIVESSTKKGKKKKGAKAGTGGKKEETNTLNPPSGSYINFVNISLV